MIAHDGSALSNTKWTLISSFINAIISLGIGAVLARILKPDIFGLTAIGFLVVAFASYFVKLWVGPALIQKELLTNEDISFAISFSLVAGIIAAFVVSLLSPLISALFHKPESALLIAALSLSLIFTSFSASINGLLRRDMKFKSMSIVGIAQTLFTGVISIVLAKIGFGAWSLVWPLLLGQFLGLLVLFYLIKQSYPVKFITSFSGHGHLLKFGSKFTLISILEYFGSNLDTIFIGRLFTSSQLGIYNRSYKLAYLPTENLIASITSVMFPVISRQQNHIEKFKETQNRLFVLVGLISTCIAMGMVPASRDIILVLLGPQWIGSISILTVVLFAVPLDFMSVTLGLSFDASGKLNEKIRIQFGTVLILIIGILLLKSYGSIGIAAALVISHLVRYIYYLISYKSIFSISFITVIRNNLSIFLAGAVTLVTSFLTVKTTIVWQLSPIQSLLIEIFVCAIFFILFLFINSPTLLGIKDLAQSVVGIRTLLTSKRSKNHE